MTDPAGTLEKALERNHWKFSTAIHSFYSTSPLVESTVRLPISTKPAFQGVGSVLAGSAECNDEVKEYEEKDR